MAAANGAPTLPAAIPAARAARTAALACLVVLSAPAGVASGSQVPSSAGEVEEAAAAASASRAAAVAPRPWLTLRLLWSILLGGVCSLPLAVLPAADEGDGEEGVTKRRKPTDGNRAVAGLSQDGSRGTDPSQLGTVTPPKLLLVLFGALLAAAADEASLPPALAAAAAAAAVSESTATISWKVRGKDVDERARSDGPLPAPMLARRARGGGGGIAADESDVEANDEDADDADDDAGGDWLSRWVAAAAAASRTWRVDGSF